MGQSKASKYIGKETRARLAANLQARLDRLYPGQKNQPRKLAELAGTRQSQIQRILGSEIGASVDMLEQIAKAIGCQPSELLGPPSPVAPRPGLPFEVHVHGDEPAPLVREIDAPRAPRHQVPHARRTKR